MENLYNQQQQDREKKFNNVINKKSGNTPFMLFPVRLETRFRTVDNDRNSHMLACNDYVFVLKEISELQEDIISEINNDTDDSFVGQYFYNRIHSIQKKIEKIDHLPDVLKNDLNKLINQILSFENLDLIKANKILKHKIIKKANNINDTFQVKINDNVHHDKHLRHTATTGQDIRQKKLGGKHIATENILPASLIAEMITINKYFGLLLKGKTIKEETLVSVLSNTAMESVHSNETMVVFNTVEEYELFDRELKKLKGNWAILVEALYGSPLGVVFDKNALWIAYLPHSFPKNIKSSGIVSEKQLCVRIFPDDIFISQFRKPLNKEEYKDAKNFHILWFIFSGNRILERSLWDSLVDKYSVHRASWLVRVFSNI